MAGFDLTELPAVPLGKSDADSFAWRKSFIRTFLERDVPQLGLRVPAPTGGEGLRVLAFSARKYAATPSAVTAAPQPTIALRRGD